MNVAVQEHIHHGDYQAVRYIEVDLGDAAAVVDMLNSCSYLRLPPADYAKGAALVSRPYDEIVAKRAREGQRVAAELAERGVAEIGWVEYRVLGRIHAPILQAAGWPAEQIRRCIEGVER
jgi:hypothetical protein